MTVPSPNPAASVPPVAPANAAHILWETVQRLLSPPGAEPVAIEAHLPTLAQIFRAEVAGLANVWNGSATLDLRITASGERVSNRSFPWQADADLVAKAHHAPAAVVGAGNAGRCLLLTASRVDEGVSWLFWMEAPEDPGWTNEDRAALALVLTALVRFMQTGRGCEEWQDRLEQARRQRRLEEAALLVGRLAHDFNNVLTGILGFTELSLGQIGTSNPAHSFLSEAYQAAQHGSQIVNRLSQFSKRSRIGAEPASFASVATEERTRLGGEWPAGVALQVEVPAELPRVAVDSEAIRQILNPLLENAREAVGSSGTIQIQARQAQLGQWDCLKLLGHPQPGAYLHITISDTGPGLTNGARQRIFTEPFFSTKPRHRGMGLAMVYGTLQAYGGGLRVENGEPGGVAVQVYLPLTSAPTGHQTPRMLSSGGSKGERLLVVDDDPLTLQLMCVTLERAGYQVQSASDGDQALDSFATTSEPFRLVLSDVVMPRMTGFDLAHRLLERDPRVNVLFTSGHIPSGFVPPDFLNRQFDLLQKPFRPDGLLRAVRTALDRDRPRDSFLVGATESEKRP